jgi:hypothetical protein
MIQAHVIQRTEQVVLLEWQDARGHVKRGYVPAALVGYEDALVVSSTLLDEAAPYGMEWERYITFRADAEAIAHELRRHGIWTVSDLERNPVTAQKAFLVVCMMQVIDLLQEVRNG